MSMDERVTDWIGCGTNDTMMAANKETPPIFSFDERMCIGEEVTVDLSPPIGVLILDLFYLFFRIPLFLV